LLTASECSSTAAGLGRVDLPNRESKSFTGDGGERLALLLATSFSTQAVAVYLEPHYNTGKGVVIHRSGVSQPWEILYDHPDCKNSTAATLLPPGTAVFYLVIQNQKYDLHLVRSADPDIDKAVDWFGSADPEVVIKALLARLLGKGTPPPPDTWVAKRVVAVDQEKIDLQSVVRGTLSEAHFVLTKPHDDFADWKATIATLDLTNATKLIMKARSLNRSDLDDEVEFLFPALVEETAAAARGEKTAGSIMGIDAMTDRLKKTTSIYNPATWNPDAWSLQTQRNYAKHFGDLMPGKHALSANKWTNLTPKQRRATETFRNEAGVESTMTDEACWERGLFRFSSALLLSWCNSSGFHWDTLAGPRSEWCNLQRVDAIVQNGPTLKIVILCDGNESTNKYVNLWAAKVARSEAEVGATICSQLGFVEREFQGNNASAVGTLAEIKTLIDNSDGRVAAFVVPAGCMYFLRAGTWHLFINFALTFSLGHDLIVSDEAKRARVGFSSGETAAAVNAILPYFVNQTDEGRDLPQVTDDHVRKALLAVALFDLNPDKQNDVDESAVEPVNHTTVLEQETTPYQLASCTSTSAAPNALSIGGVTDQPLMSAWWVVEKYGGGLRVVGWAAALLPPLQVGFGRVSSLMKPDKANVLTASLTKPGLISGALTKNVATTDPLELEDGWLINLGTWLQDGWTVNPITR
jgi:hypothetical protein